MGSRKSTSARFASDVDRNRAFAMAEALLLRRYRVSQVVSVLQEQPVQTREGKISGGLGLNAKQARAAVEAVQAMWEKEETFGRENRRRLQLRTLDNLVSAAFRARDYRTCLEVEKLIAKIEGNYAPTDRPGLPGADMVPASDGVGGFEDEYEDRSEAELEHFVEHGVWPEEHLQ